MQQCVRSTSLQGSSSVLNSQAQTCRNVQWSFQKQRHVSAARCGEEVLWVFCLLHSLEFSCAQTLSGRTECWNLQGRLCGAVISAVSAGDIYESSVEGSDSVVWWLTLWCQSFRHDNNKPWWFGDKGSTLDCATNRKFRIFVGLHWLSQQHSRRFHLFFFDKI